MCTPFVPSLFIDLMNQKYMFVIDITFFMMFYLHVCNLYKKDIQKKPQTLNNSYQWKKLTLLFLQEILIL